VGLAGGVAVGQSVVRRTRTDPVLEGPVLEGPVLEGPVLEGPVLDVADDVLVRGPLADGARVGFPLDGVEVHQLVLSDGAHLRVLARGTGPAIVLIHGISLTADVWYGQLRDLGDAGFRVVAPDLRGHGGSTVGTGGLRLDRLADDIAEVLERLDLSDVLLVGHSMGGMLVLRLLTRERPSAAGDDGPGRVRALGLVATSASPVVGRGVPGVRAVIALAAPLLEATGRVASSLPGRSMLDTDLGDPVARIVFGVSPSPEDVRLIRRVTARVPARIAASLLVQLVSFDAERHLRRVARPTTVVVGTADVMTPLRHAETLAEAIPDAELVVLPDCGHMVMLERPGELAAALLALADRAGIGGGREPARLP
jgi:pimeloyl-ACP methyl ester carboxylesterase